MNYLENVPLYLGECILLQIPKSFSLILSPIIPTFVLILDLRVKFEIFNEDTDKSSEATAVSEARGI